LRRSIRPFPPLASGPPSVGALDRAMGDAEAKRAANIKAKEEQRKATNEEIKQQKAAKQKERDEAKAKADQEQADAAAKKAAIEEKRAKNVADKEASRSKTDSGGGGSGKKQAHAKGASKYSKKDVLELKKVFDEYDKDGSGRISLAEFTASLKLKREMAAPKPGEKSSLDQRNAAKGISLVDLSEGVFHEMDEDGDGEVGFAELLKLFYRYARPDEIEAMMSYVAPEPEPEPEPKPELSKEAIQQIRQIFKLYDKDKSGSLTFAELKKALEKTGIDPEEIKEYFDTYDGDGNGTIDKEEFEKLMESTGAFDDS